jgi:hypothetical protein
MELKFFEDFWQGNQTMLALEIQSLLVGEHYNLAKLVLNQVGLPL